MTGSYNEQEICSVTKDADVIVAVVGEYASMSGEAASRSDITLPGDKEIFRKTVKGGKAVIACLMIWASSGVEMGK